MKAKQVGYYPIPNIKISKTKYIRWKKISKKLNLSRKCGFKFLNLGLFCLASALVCSIINVCGSQGKYKYSKTES